MVSEDVVFWGLYDARVCVAAYGCFLCFLFSFSLCLFALFYSGLIFFIYLLVFWRER